MKTVKYSVDYAEPASRMELLVRFVYWIPMALVIWVLGIVSGICMVGQWLHILFTRKRHATLQKYIRLYMEYMVAMNSYLYLLTEERPPIMPEGA